MSSVRGKWDMSIVWLTGSVRQAGDTQVRLGRDWGVINTKQATHLGRDPNSRIIFYIFPQDFYCENFQNMQKT